jgi:hypothetical protein
MSCPFYSASLNFKRDANEGGVLFNSGGNQCALITSAHSPCWMEVSESRPPEWAACPRNPEALINMTRPGEWGPLGPRLYNHSEDMRRLFRARAAREEASEDMGPDYGPRGRCGGGIE